MGTYCGLTKYEWIQSLPAGGLYKYTEKYVETDNVMHTFQYTLCSLIKIVFLTHLFNKRASEKN